MSNNQDKLVAGLHEQLQRAILTKKRIKFQINKDVRFNESAHKTIEQLGNEYAQADIQSKELRNTLTSFGELIDWSKEQE
jgi:hypothetical protein